MSHRLQVLLALGVCILMFFVWAKVDAMGRFEGKIYYDLSVIGIPIQVPWYWFWMWCVGYPVFAFVVAVAYYAGAEDTERNFWYAVGIFVTLLLFAFGQLEDFMWHVFNGFAFPTGDWSTVGWTTENNFYCCVFGTWTTPMHLIWFTVFCVVIPIVMWIIIVRYA